MTTTPPPRVHVIPARAAPVAAVVARGPSRWCHVLRWDLAAPAVEPGAWIRATIYPRRCDVSPDGSLLCAFVLASKAPPWDSYYAVSKLPWLTALAAWRVGSTYAAPCEFHPDGGLALGFAPGTTPDHGSFPRPLRALTPLPESPASVWAVSNLANELRRGWRLSAADRAAAATSATPASAAELVIERERPGGGARLLLVHAGHDFRQRAVEGVQAHYALEEGGLMRLLEGVGWADWDAEGRLLAATTDGALEIREPGANGWTTGWRHHVPAGIPEPRPAPEWAGRW
jgi:hypothetical protein